jgi:adenylate kinase family enzyme
MHGHFKQIAENKFESSFEITLEETLKTLYERRLEINKLLRSLEAEKSKKLEQKLKPDEVSSKKDRPEPVSKRRNTYGNSTAPKSQFCNE